MGIDTQVNLVISGSTRGISAANKQLATMLKQVNALSGAGGKGAVKGGALFNSKTGGMLGSLGFAPGESKQILQFQKQFNSLQRAGFSSTQAHALMTRKHGAAMQMLGMKSKFASKGIKETGRQAFFAGLFLRQMGMAMVAVAAAFTALGVGSVKAFMAFESNLADVQSLAGLTTDEIGILGESMRTLSKDTIFSANDITKAGVALARTGIIASDGIGTYNSIMEAAIVLTTDFATQGQTLTSSVESITRTMRQFELGAEDTTRIINALAGGTAFSLASIKDLEKGLSYAGAAAKSMNIPLEETVAVLGTLANVGITGGRAGRQFRNILVRLGTAMKNPSKRQEDLAASSKDLGLNWKKLDFTADGLQGTLQKLKGAINNVADASDAVRQRAAVAFLILAKQSGGLAELTKRIATGNKAMEMYKIQVDTLNSKFKILRSNVIALGIAIGAELEPFVTKVVTGLTNLVRKLDALTPAQKRLAIIVGATTAALLALSGVLLIVIGFMKSATFGIATLVTLLSTSGTVILGVVGGIAAIVAGIGALLVVVAIAKVLWNNFNEALNGIPNKLIGEWLDKTIASFKQWAVMIQVNKAAIASWATKYVKAMVIIKQLPTMLANAAKEFATKGTMPFITMRNQIEHVWENFDVKSLLFGGEGEKDFVSDVKDELASMIDAIKGALGNLVPEDMSALDSLIDRVSAKVKGLTALWGLNGEAAEKEIARISTVLTDLTGTTDDIIENMSKTWADTLFDMLKGATTWKEVWQSILDDALRNFLHGFIRGMLEGWGQALGQMVAQYVKAQFFMAAISTGLNALSLGTSAAVPTATPGASMGDISNPLQFADGGIIRKPTVGLVGESGPEAIVPLDQYNKGGGGESLTIINVIDPNFVNTQIARSPNTIINVINDDMIRGGTTRKTIKRIR